jgi:hypothetical protein
MNGVTAKQWCSQELGSNVKSGSLPQLLQHPDDQAVVSLDDVDSEEPRSDKVGVEHHTNRTEQVGPFEVTIFMEDDSVKQSKQAAASCLINRVVKCAPGAHSKMQCRAVTKATCESVTGPKSLCTNSSGGVLVGGNASMGEDAVVCKFKDCNTPASWVTANDNPITPDSWCYVKNIEYGANFAPVDDSEAGLGLAGLEPQARVSSPVLLASPTTIMSPSLSPIQEAQEAQVFSLDSDSQRE